VQTTFRPRNPEDYSKLDFLREKLAEQGVRWHGPEPEDEQEELPRGCKMPLGEAAQIYELCRIFRL
jgi:hypothetical protein